MNELLQELAQQAVTEAAKYCQRRFDTSVEENETFALCFAELIVRECSNWLKQPVNQTPSCGVTMNIAADRLKEHFGIES